MPRERWVQGQGITPTVRLPAIHIALLRWVKPDSNPPACSSTRSVRRSAPPSPCMARFQEYSICTLTLSSSMSTPLLCHADKIAYCTLTSFALRTWCQPRHGDSARLSANLLFNCGCGPPEPGGLHSSVSHVAGLAVHFDKCAYACDEPMPRQRCACYGPPLLAHRTRVQIIHACGISVAAVSYTHLTLPTKA